MKLLNINNELFEADPTEPFGGYVVGYITDDNQYWLRRESFPSPSETRWAMYAGTFRSATPAEFEAFRRKLAERAVTPIVCIAGRGSGPSDLEQK